MACSSKNGILKKLAVNPDLRAQLLASPAATLQANGVAVPDGAKVIIHELPAGQPNLVLPEKLEQWEECCCSADITAVVKAVFADPTLRQQLREAPAAVFAAVLGREFPAAAKMQVFSNSASEFHFVIPAAGKELSDDELAKVAGGGVMDVVCGLMWHTRIGCNPMCCTICEITDCIHHATR